MGRVASISKEEQVECMEKIFREMQGYCSSRGAWRCGMERHIIYLTLEGYKWEVVGRSLCCRGRPVGERSALVGDAPFPLFCFPAREE